MTQQTLPYTENLLREKLLQLVKKMAIRRKTFVVTFLYAHIPGRHSMDYRVALNNSQENICS